MATKWSPGSEPLYEHAVTLDGGWTLTLHVGSDDQKRYVVDGLLLEPPGTVPTGGVGVALWRSIPIGRLAAAAVESVYTWQQAAIEEVYGQRERITEAFKRRPGPSGHPQYLYAVLADHYVQQWQVGDRKAAETTARWFDMERATFARRLHEARRRGLLTSEGKGTAGGQLTPLARQLIDSDEAQRFLNGED